MRTRKGFTLVEMAIVLVIISLILGAVLKGKDLIANANAKRFISEVRKWEIYQWAFFDRMGRFLGDRDASGIIGDDSSDDAESDMKNYSFFSNPPDDNKIGIGGNTFYIYYGHVTLDNKTHNAILVCANADCSQSFKKEAVVYLNAFDSMIDGSAGDDGDVACMKEAPSDISDKNDWIVTDNDTGSKKDDCDENSKAMFYIF